MPDQYACPMCGCVREDVEDPITDNPNCHRCLSDLYKVTPDNQPVSVLEQLRAAQREFLLRQKVYPRWVATGRLGPAKADQELLAMAAIIRTLEALAEWLGINLEEPVHADPQQELL